MIAQRRKAIAALGAALLTFVAQRLNLGGLDEETITVLGGIIGLVLVHQLPNEQP